MKMKQIVLLTTLLLCVVFTGFSQNEHPVSWTLESEEIEPLTYKVSLHATIRKPYYIYPQSSGGGIGMPTEIIFADNPNVELVGETEEKGRASDSEKGASPYYQEGVTFSQVVKLKVQEQTTLSVNVKYMACQGMMCLPPSSKDLTLVLYDDTAAVEGSEQRSASFNDFYAMWRGQNKLAPDFTAYDADGNAHRLSDFRGKVVVLDFWFTTCHMCIKGFPGMQEIAAKYGDQDLVVIALGIPEDHEDFNEFVRKNRAKYPDFIWLQDRTTMKFRDAFANKDYGMFGAPSQVIINKEGRVVGATNFKPQVISALPLAGIKVDASELAEAQKEAKALEDRMKRVD